MVEKFAVDRIPLASLRTFAVVARLMSISRAAQELNVTPSAVSHQIRLLEEYLATPLFRRENNKIKLTPAGQQYLSHVSEGLFLLVRATQTIKGAKGQQVLRIAAPPSFAYLWLISRIARFIKAHPDIPVTITACPDPVPMLATLFEAGFSYGTTGSGLHAEPLGVNRVFPVCSPTLAKGDHGLRSPADLARCTLLESSDEAYYQYKEPRQPRWAEWLQSAGVENLSAMKYLNLTPSAMVHKAAICGAGVGLSRSLLAVDALAEKRLVVPFGPVLTHTANYHLIYPSHLGRRRDIVAFRNWVVAEAEASAKKLTRLLGRVATR